MGSDAVSASIDHLAEAVRACASFNGGQESRLRELQAVVARLRENWRSAASARKFDEVWERLRNSTTRMHSAMDQMINNLNVNQRVIDDAAQRQARTIDASDASGSHAGAARHYAINNGI